MLTDVVPLRAVVFQVLFLLVAIAVEAQVLRRELGIAPRKSVDYASTINLLSTIVGWLLLFNLQPFLPPNLRAQLLNIILFDQWADGIVVVVVTAFVTFFLSFFIKLQGLTLLQLLLDERPQPSPADEPPKRKTFRSPHRSNQQETSSREAGAVLLANAASYSTILVILFLRFLAQTNFQTPVL